MIYLYYCAYCDKSFEIKKPMAKSGEDEVCPKCGVKAMRRYTAVAHTFGWRLTEKSHEKGNKDELERDI